MADRTEFTHRDHLYDTMLEYLEVVLRNGKPGFCVTSEEIDIFLDYAREIDRREIAKQKGMTCEQVKCAVRNVRDGMRNVVSTNKKWKEEQSQAMERCRLEQERQERLSVQETVMEAFRRKNEEQQRAVEEREKQQKELRDAQEKACREVNEKQNKDTVPIKRKAFTPNGVRDTHGRYKDMSSHGPNLHETFNLINQTGIDINEGRKTIINGRLVDSDNLEDWRDRD